MARDKQTQMTRGGGVHTVPGRIPGWINEMAGKVLSRHQTKVEAVAAGLRYARRLRVEHTIHKRDGVIAEKNSYGKDSYPPKDAR